MASEFTITFSGAGGHNHDGVSSSRVDTTSYSIFDFRTGVIGSNQSRIALQEANKISFDNYILNILNTKEFSPTLIKIKPSSLTGKTIVQGTLSADRFETNMVLVKQQMTSENYNGVISNNAIVTNGTTGWAITSTGTAEFNNVYIRGTVEGSSTDGFLYSANLELKSTGSIVSHYDYYGYGIGDSFYTDVSINDFEGLGQGAVTVSGTASGSLSTRVYSSSGVYNPSDIRLKNIIIKETDALSIVNNIEVVNFTYNNDINSKEHYGFIAQQLYENVKDAVFVGGDDANKLPWMVSKEELIPYLTKAIQQLSNKIDALEAKGV